MKSMRGFRLIIFQQRRRMKFCQGKFFTMYPLLGNDKGIAIVAALLVLMLLSVIAVTFTDTTVTEKTIVRSEAVFERVFFKAESGAMEGVQKVMNETSHNELLPALGGAVNNAGLLVSVERADKENNVAMTDATGDSKFTDADIPAWDPSEADTKTYRRVVLAEGSYGSLKVTDPRDYYYTAFGYSDADNGSAMIKIGFVKHF